MRWYGRSSRAGADPVGFNPCAPPPAAKPKQWRLAQHAGAVAHGCEHCLVGSHGGVLRVARSMPRIVDRWA